MYLRGMHRSKTAELAARAVTTQGASKTPASVAPHGIKTNEFRAGSLPIIISLLKSPLPIAVLDRIRTCFSLK
jgi:hypothetical protein